MEAVQDRIYEDVQKSEKFKELERCYAGKRCLVTGAGGFVGVRLVCALLKLNVAQVNVADVMFPKQSLDFYGAFSFLS
jgi:FlaA1/EpsC-like NDP-sugar epimerase